MLVLFAAGVCNLLLRSTSQVASRKSRVADRGSEILGLGTWSANDDDEQERKRGENNAEWIREQDSIH